MPLGSGCGPPRKPAGSELHSVHYAVRVERVRPEPRHEVVDALQLLPALRVSRDVEEDDLQVSASGSPAAESCIQVLTRVLTRPESVSEAASLVPVRSLAARLLESPCRKAPVVRVEAWAHHHEHNGH